jgi:hypothetical protein
MSGLTIPDGDRGVILRGSAVLVSAGPWRGVEPLRIVVLSQRDRQPTTSPVQPMPVIV